MASEVQSVQNKPIPQKQKPVEREPQPEPKVERTRPPAKHQVDVLV